MGGFRLMFKQYLGDIILVVLLTIFLLGPEVIYIFYHLAYLPGKGKSKRTKESKNMKPARRLSQYSRFLKTDTFKKIGRLK